MVVMNIPFESLAVRFLPCKIDSSTTPGPTRGGEKGRKKGGGRKKGRKGGRKGGREGRKGGREGGRTIKTCKLNTQRVRTITFIRILCLPRIQHLRNFLHLLKRQRSNISVKLLLHWCHSSLPPSLPPSLALLVSQL